MSLPANLRLKRDQLDAFRRSIRALTEKEVLVGFPQESAERDPEPGEDSQPITNAALGYIHNNGAPEQNIPQREFMESGIASVRDELIDQLEDVARHLVVHGGTEETVEKLMHRVGMTAELALKNKVNEGIPPPLAESTLKDRARRGRKGAKMELARRAEGEDPSTQFAKPLIDTTQMRNAIKYVIRSTKQRK